MSRRGSVSRELFAAVPLIPDILVTDATLGQLDMELASTITMLLSLDFTITITTLTPCSAQPQREC